MIEPISIRLAFYRQQSEIERERELGEKERRRCSMHSREEKKEQAKRLFIIDLIDD